MKDDPIDPKLREFILAHFDSVVKLEALVLLRQHPGDSWTAADAAARLYVQSQVAEAALDQLSVDGLVTKRDGGYSYDPASIGRAELVERLAHAYSRALIPVTELVHRNPRRLRQLADAFRFRKEK